MYVIIYEHCLIASLHWVASFSCVARFITWINKTKSLTSCNRLGEAKSSWLMISVDWWINYSPLLQSNYQQIKRQEHILKYRWWRTHWECPSSCLWSEPKILRKSLLATLTTDCSKIEPFSLCPPLLFGNLLKRDKWNVVWFFLEIMIGYD